MRKILVVSIFFLSGHLSAQWVQQNSGTTQNLYTVYFTNANTGFAAGARGTILKTTNGGINWINLTTDTTYNYNEMVFINSTTGIMVGSNGLVLRTTNEGNNWIQQISGTTQPLVAVDFNSNLIIACGANGTIISSTNTGINWTTITTPVTSYITDVSIPSPNTIYMGGYGSLIKSTNGGENWSILQNCSGKGCFFYNKIQFFNATTGYGTGFINGSLSYYFKKTTNGGSNFTSSMQPCDNFHFIDINNGFVLRIETIYRTTNGGINWVTNTMSGLRFNDVYMSSLNIATVVGSSGLIMRTTTGGLVFIEPVNNNTPEHFSLKQNYPNPFNPLSNIEFSISSPEFVTLKIFDANGKEIELLINQNLSVGNYKIQWNAQNHSGGVYFYKLETKNFSETKKMILLK
jgi:photosystem II stability/assembly factor-like uncharacterized protein